MALTLHGVCLDREPIRRPTNAENAGGASRRTLTAL